MTTAASFIDPMQASLREIRMVIERLAQWKGVEPGMIFSVTDCGLYSAALGLSGFFGLEAQLEKIAACAGARPDVQDHDGLILVDANGAHAWLIAEAALDLAIASYRRGQGGRVMVVNVTERAELAVVSAIAQKHELSATARMDDGDAVHITVTVSADRRSVLDQVRRAGVEVRRDLWFHLFKLSSNALAEDTVISRTHTGTFVIYPDGRVEGDEHAEFGQDDLSMLTAEKLEFRR
jgi:hypothetical protein